jgi:hypothetical protein
MEIAFLTLVNNEELYKNCLESINNLIIPDNRNYPNFSDPAPQQGILFNLYLIGYKVVETVRFRGVTIS